MLRQQIRRAVDAAQWRRVPRRLRDVHYLWYNAAKKRPVHTREGFSGAARLVAADRRTMLREDRLFTLWQAAQQLRPADGIVVEVGVYRGGGSALLAEATTNPVFACDTFAGHIEVDPAHDTEHRVGDFHDTSYEDVAAYLSRWPNVKVLAGDIRDTAAALPDEPIALAHLDVDVYPPTRWCLDLFVERMTTGGVVVVDDYGFTTCPGARDAVDEHVADHANAWWALELLTGQAVLVRL